MTGATDVQNVFVLGLDEHNAQLLRSLPGADRYRFHALLDIDDLLHRETIPVPELLEQAQRQLAEFDGRVDAVIGFWDFPISTMVPILARRLGLPWPSLESVLKCEHKYWSRLEQRAVIEEVPRFGLLDLDDPAPDLPEGLAYPVWIKPVKSASSKLAFRVENHKQLHDAAAEIREGVGRIGDPFEFVLGQVDLPPEIAEAGGSACLVEEAASGVQVTVEGYSYRGDVRVYGIVDSVHCPDSPSFLRYQYPSTVSAAVADRLADISRRVITRIGLDGTTFDIEYFWDAERDAVTLLEVNPRHSQSHAELFEQVDGFAHHDVMLQLALGREPRPPHREGRSAVAAKWFVRRAEDGVAVRVPTAEEIERVEREVPGCTVTVSLQPGDRLSEQHDQDSYTYAIANVFVGADSEDELREKYERVVAGLPFEFEEA
ncbi:ATP-grasp domain-containing protein [Pseudonocardia kunmingensis]|uniref:ATP-grasp domain-containing protein n=1 Tax=Pseudonocardia kunmingensis TaxID=630975 RepID=UPI001FE8492B|nr:ATP-grasp domain-containing protein [Pseudonocardia kunmingensis]